MKEYSKSAFVADVIKALEDAERASHQNQKDKGTLARDAYSKLQYDYPVSWSIAISSLQTNHTFPAILILLCSHLSRLRLSLHSWSLNKNYELLQKLYAPKNPGLYFLIES